MRDEIYDTLVVGCERLDPMIAFYKGSLAYGLDIVDVEECFFINSTSLKQFLWDAEPVTSPMHFDDGTNKASFSCITLKNYFKLLRQSDVFVLETLANKNFTCADIRVMSVFNNLSNRIDDLPMCDMRSFRDSFFYSMDDYLEKGVFWQVARLHNLFFRATSGEPLSKALIIPEHHREYFDKYNIAYDFNDFSKILNGFEADNIVLNSIYEECLNMVEEVRVYNQNKDMCSKDDQSAQELIDVVEDALVELLGILD